MDVKVIYSGMEHFHVVMYYLSNNKIEHIFIVFPNVANSIAERVLYEH